jgi:hypothetical protein
MYSMHEINECRPIDLAVELQKKWMIVAAFDDINIAISAEDCECH